MINIWQELPKPFTVLAPMEDVTDTVFRQIVSSCGRPDLFFTEFTNVDGLASEGRQDTIHRLQYTDMETPLIAQVWGSTPEHYYQAAKEISRLGFAGIDINMGCPVRKVVKKGVGAALIGNYQQAEAIIKATQAGAAGHIPVSVKTRIGFDQVITEEWAEFLLNQNIAALTIHGRTASQQSKAPADWHEVAKVVAVRDQVAPQTVIVGNGDVRSLSDGQIQAANSDVDGFMIGRGIFQDLFVFNSRRSISDLTPHEKLQLLLKHAELFTQTWGSQKNFAVLKKFFKIYVKGFAGAAELRQHLMDATDLKSLKQMIKAFEVQ